MNKKILTLSTGLMLSSALAFAADVKDLKVVSADSFKSGNNYYVVADVDGNGKVDPTDIMLNLSNNSGSLDGNLTKTINDVNLSAKGYLFTVSAKSDISGKVNYYTLFNSDADAFLAGENQAIVTNASDSKKSDGRFWRFYNSEKYNGSSVLQSFAGNYFLDPQVGGFLMNGYAANSDKILFCVAQSENVSAATLNQTLGGEGLFLGFKDSDKVDGNVFEDTKLKAFEITGNFAPKGIYFATEYPAELNSKNTISTIDEFKKCTFIAVTPNSFMDVHKFDRSKGHGFKFDKVAASSMNFYLGDINADEMSQNDEVFVGNACFKVVEEDAVNAEGKYILSLSNARLVVKADDKEDSGDIKHNNPGEIFVAAPADLGVNYLVTYESGKEFEAVKGNLLDPSALIKTTKEASYYAIQFVSGEGEENSEYGQYLTANTAGQWFSIPSVNVNDPLYQFVVSSVDLTNKTVTFTNRETGKYVTMSLYGEASELTFNVASATSFKVAVNKDGDYKFATASTPLSTVKVKLIPVTVEDKFASFLNSDEATTMVSFKLAKSNVASEKVFVAAKRNAKDEVIAGRVGISEDNADKFVLYKSKDASYIAANNFTYMEGKNARVETAKDSVLTYTYNVKLYQDNDNEAGLYLDQSTYLTSGELDNAQEWVIKTNEDGVAYLMPVTISSKKVAPVLFLESGFDATKPLKGQNAWTTVSNTYRNFEEMLNQDINTYLVPEAPAVSLEAKGQHVAFQAERGGYVSMNENGQAVVAVKTVADEDLTFWLDTADSEKTVPSFLISKGGKFLYNAADSAANLVNGADYIINNDKSKCRMIFKAGSYADNLLVTTINGKETTVAEKADALKKYVGGLDNFKFRIVKSEDEDYYFIRPVGKGGYVQNLNGELTTTNDKKEALRVEVEAMEAPTSNEGVSASEVAVVAQNGSVVVKNAAGKNVVVSTILGQVVANEVLTSDNATINVPAGIVVVAVDGESFKVSVK